MRFLLSLLAAASLATLSAVTARVVECEANVDPRQLLRSLPDHAPVTKAVLEERRQSLLNFIAQHPFDVFLHLDYRTSDDGSGNEKTERIPSAATLGLSRNKGFSLRRPADVPSPRKQPMPAS
ncbi:MAG: hypothetical protein WA715_19750 [Candidatus Acidiferrum sp.]